VIDLSVIFLFNGFDKSDSRLHYSCVRNEIATTQFYLEQSNSPVFDGKFGVNIISSTASSTDSLALTVV